MDKNIQKYLIKLVEKNYNDISEEFNQTRQKEPWQGLSDLAKSVEDGQSVLDVGCGNGRLVRLFTGKQVQYLGVDSSHNMVTLAKNNFPDYHFISGDILKLDEIKHANFNFVFCIAVLHHIPGMDLRIAALKQLKYKVANDGKIIVSVWNMWSQKKFRRIILKYALLKLIGKNKMDYGDIVFGWKNSDGEELSERYYHAFTLRELKKIVNYSGLKIEKIYNDKFNYYLILKK